MAPKAFEGLQPAAEIVGGDEVCEVAPELIVAVVVVALDRCFLERAIHPLDLAVGPWVFWLGGAVVYIGRGASEFKGMRTELFSVRQSLLDERGRRATGAWRHEVDAVVGQYDVDL